MAETKQIPFRLDVGLVERIDAYAAKVSREMPGVTFTRANAVRLLLEKALANEGFPLDDGPEGKSPRRRKAK